MGSVAELWAFPVKSFQGFPVEHLTIGPDGVDGDRTWGVVDPASGHVLSAKRWPDLLAAGARVTDDGTVVVCLPDGAEYEAGSPDADAAVSALLDHAVALRRAGAGAPGLPFEMHTDATDDASPLFEFAGPPGRFVDLAAVHLLTTASLRAAAERYPAGDWDIRRFRPTALLDVDGDGFVEDAWVGGRVGLGGNAVVTPFMPTVRCSMTTRAQPGLGRDVDIARTLNQHHDLNLGVYCAVERAGAVRVGDPVAV